VNGDLVGEHHRAQLDPGPMFGVVDVYGTCTHAALVALTPTSTTTTTTTMTTMTQQQPNGIVTLAPSNVHVV
jgi:hypothetical protein